MKSKLLAPVLAATLYACGTNPSTAEVGAPTLDADTGLPTQSDTEVDSQRDTFASDVFRELDTDSSTDALQEVDMPDAATDLDDTDTQDTLDDSAVDTNSDTFEDADFADISDIPDSSEYCSEGDIPAYAEEGIAIIQGLDEVGVLDEICWSDLATRCDLALMLDVIHNFLPCPEGTEVIFTDISDTCNEAANRAICEGTMSAFPDGNFHGSVLLNTAEIALISARSFGLDVAVLPSLEETGWTDELEEEVSGRWYEESVKLMWRAGAITTYADTGRLEVDRQQINTDLGIILCRLMGSCEARNRP